MCFWCNSQYHMCSKSKICNNMVCIYCGFIVGNRDNFDVFDKYHFSYHVVDDLNKKKALNLKRKINNKLKKHKCVDDCGWEKMILLALYYAQNV